MLNENGASGSAEQKQRGEFVATLAAAVAEGSRLVLPAFWPEAVEVWFFCCETIFEDRNIASARRNFNAIVDHFPAEVGMQVIDLFRDHDTYQDSYKALKIRLSINFILSRWKRMELLE